MLVLSHNISIAPHLDSVTSSDHSWISFSFKILDFFIMQRLTDGQQNFALLGIMWLKEKKKLEMNMLTKL